MRNLLSRREFLAGAVGGIGGVTAIYGNQDTLPTYDLFLIGGQSNAQGHGWITDHIPKIQPGNAYEFFTDGDDPGLTHLEQPVGGANRGSAWPAFHREYHRITGRKAVYIPHGAPATGMSKKSAPPHAVWNGGLVRDNAEQMLADCEAKLAEDGMSYRFCGMLWSQGLRDAHAIENGEMVIEDYRIALREFYAWTRNHQTLDKAPFYIFQTGHDNDGDSEACQQVRQEQVNLAFDESAAKIVSYKQQTFPERDLMRGTYHYNQIGLNIMGQTGARHVAADG